MAMRYSVIVTKGRNKEIFWYPMKSNRDSAYANFVRNRPDSTVAKGQDIRLQLKVHLVDGTFKIAEFVTEAELKEARDDLKNHKQVKRTERLH